MIVNIHTGKYASLGHWYNVVSVREKDVELKNEFDGNIYILSDPYGLEWI